MSLQIFWFCLIAVLWGGYFLLEGFDFGVGMLLPVLATEWGVLAWSLREAVTTWQARYGQRAWLRQLDPEVTGEMEDGVLRTIARLDGTPFPSTTRLASRWLLGRAPVNVDPSYYQGEAPALLDRLDEVRRLQERAPVSVPRAALRLDLVE